MHTRQRPTVLVVDDDHDVRRAIQDALVADGYDVVGAASGEAALDMVNKCRPDAVVLDLVMPGTDGCSVCAALRAHPAASHIPIVIMTGAGAHSELVERAYQAGADDFVVKPIVRPVLAQRLRYLLKMAGRAHDAREKERRLRHAQRMARIAHWEWDVDNRTLRLSPDMASLFGLAQQGPEDTGWDALLRHVHPSERLAVETQINEALEHRSSCSIEFRLLGSAGAERIVMQESEFVTDPMTAEVRFIGAVQDITALRRAEIRVNRLAYFDGLTGLPNRVYLREQLGRTVAEARRHQRSFAILGVDLDLFKRVNDTMGHSAGDRLLRQVANRLRRVLRSGDTVSVHPTELSEANRDGERGADTIARMGADEFMVVLSEVRNPMDAALVAQRILSELALPFVVERSEIFVSASLGIVAFPGDGEDVDALLQNVDTALHNAKESGRNGFKFFKKEMNERAQSRVVLENGMRQGIERDEFVLHYQPRIDLRTGRLQSVEALVRWRHPERGLVPPMDFIPIAEESGLIVPLGVWVLRAALRQIKAWRGDGHIVPTAVNVSARQFREPDLVDTIARCLTEADVDPALLQIEITEGVVMQDTGASAKALQAIRALGIRVALDDFGTGYSSLSYLTRFPIDILKIDRSFVMGLPASKSSATITAAIIGLSNGLGLEVCAEGIETQEQLAFLREQGCHEGQGYLFAKPLPAPDLTRWLQERERVNPQAIALGA